MKIRSSLVVLPLTLLLASTSAAAQGAEDGGSVRLPLADYLRLVEQAEALARQARRDVEAPVADLAAQKTSISIDGGVAEIVTTFQVELAGTPTVPVALPFTGIAEEVAIEPRHGASLDLHDGRAVLYAPRPGSYAVTVRGRQSLDGDGGVDRLRLAASPAPVASVEVGMPAENEWSCPGAVVVGEETRGERRLVFLAPGRGEEHVLEMRRRLLGREEDRILARTSVVTVAEVRDRHLRRQDVVFYEVLRGELGTFELSLPPALELDRVATDEGDALPLVDDRRLTVERQRRLAGAGHLVVTYRAQDLGAGTLPLTPLEPRIAPRDRYLVAASAVAAEVRPLPAESWRRIDLEDLPERLREQIWALRPNALWRLADDTAPARLAAAPLPAAARLGGVVWERDTTTFLTVDGALVHSDRFKVESNGTAFEVALPPGATLWSARVDGVAVRPLERGATIVVPLSFRSQGAAVVELVAVEERAIERGRSTLRVEAPQVGEPVVRHEWRLLLPETNRYRFAAGELAPVVEYGAAAAARGGRRKSGEPLSSVRALPSVPAPVPGLSGVVTDAEGYALPGATVSVHGAADQVQITDANGHFRFPNLPGGKYSLEAALDGFSTVQYPEIRVVGGRATQLEVNLSAAIEETITVTSESPLLDARAIEKRRREAENERLRESFVRELEKIPGVLVGGVKPLRVEIPESGKLLVLAGALPPPRVSVELDVKAR